MKRMACAILGGMLWGLAVMAPAAEWCEAWSRGYSGEDATGEHVIAFWPFSEADPRADASGNGHELSLQGAEIASAGRFEAALESFPGWPVQDRQHAARAANDPALSPPGAFSLEMWIRPKPELDEDYQDAFLLDKKYVADDDYQLILGRPDRRGARVLRAVLGFGEDSATWHAQPARFEPGEWSHVAFTYDGQGDGRFYRNGMPWGGGYQPGRRAVHPGRHPLSISDRIGSYYRGFPGYLDHVFAVNDHREFGDYVGHHGLVMENGLPSESRLSVDREGGGVYDLMRQQRLSTRQDDGRLSFPVRLGPCDGRIYLILERPIDSLQIKAPETAVLGDRLAFQVRILDPEGTPVPAVLPVHLSIQDAEGREAEYSGYYGAAGGQLEIELDLAANDSWGVWTIQARELASGQSSMAHFRVRGPEDWPPGGDD